MSRPSAPLPSTSGDRHMRIPNSSRGVVISLLAVGGCSQDWSVDESSQDAGRPLQTALDSAVSVAPPTDTERCFLDRDKDGVGAGAAVSCAASGTVVDPPQSTRNDDCDDNDARRSPSVTDVCGDGVDNDCDSKVDEETNNACGGSCAQALQHQPGEACSNGLLGACKRSGVYECAGTGVSCNAPKVEPGKELCGDGVDNDCNGEADETGATDAPAWYQDCDHDGFAATTVGAIRACKEPEPLLDCLWTLKKPDEQNHKDWDCNDEYPGYHPGANYGLRPVGQTSFDLNCSGTAEPSPVPPAGMKICPDSFIRWYQERTECLDAACDTYLAIDRCFAWEWGTPPGGPSAMHNSPGTFTCPDTGRNLHASCFTLNGVKRCQASDIGPQVVWLCR